MLLKQMLEAPTTSSNLVVFDPFQAFDREALIKEVIGLANSPVDGPRNILFGVNPGALNGDRIVGIPDSAVIDLKRAHRLVSTMIEPFLELAFIFDRINGKLVGTLEIGGCEFGPYFLAQDLSDELRRGVCWVREDRELRQIERRELQNGHAANDEEVVEAVTPEDVSLSVGFGNDPDCEFIEVTVPDTSDPPFAEAGDSGDASRFTQALKDTVGTVTSRLMRIANGGRGTAEQAEDAGKEIEQAARKHYFYEERAVKVDLCIRNESDVDIRDLNVEIALPKVAGFDVADRIYTNPFGKREEIELRRLKYPEVEHRDDSILVRHSIICVPAEKTQALFTTSLRIAVGPKARGRKVAMQYVIRGPNGKRLSDGRLKVRLGQKVNATDAAASTASRDLAET